MTPEEQLERVRMCLAEAGYNPAHAHLDVDYEVAVTMGQDAPDFIVWRSLVLGVGAENCACWPCWRKDQGEECDHPVDPFCAEGAEAAA